MSWLRTQVASLNKLVSDQSIGYCETVSSIKNRPKPVLSRCLLRIQSAHPRLEGTVQLLQLYHRHLLAQETR